MKLSTSILNLNKTKEDLKQINNTTTDYIHLDIMDNKFVDNYSDMYDFIKENNVTKKLDVHLMVEDVKTYIEKYSELKPDFITIHYEIKQDLNELINLIKSKNIKVGIAINPDTEVNKIINYLDKIDLVLVMSVFPGLGGQKYIDIKDKIKQLRSYNKNILIEVDGGINDTNINQIDSDICVVGSFITSHTNYQEQINKLNI